MEIADYLRVELHVAARTEMVTRLEDFMRRRSKIDLVVHDDDIAESAGLARGGRDPVRSRGRTTARRVLRRRRSDSARGPCRARAHGHGLSARARSSSTLVQHRRARLRSELACAPRARIRALADARRRRTRPHGDARVGLRPWHTVGGGKRLRVDRRSSNPDRCAGHDAAARPRHRRVSAPHFGDRAPVDRSLARRPCSGRRPSYIGHSDARRAGALSRSGGAVVGSRSARGSVPGGRPERGVPRVRPSARHARRHHRWNTAPRRRRSGQAALGGSVHGRLRHGPCRGVASAALVRGHQSGRVLRRGDRSVLQPPPRCAHP